MGAAMVEAVQHNRLSIAKFLINEGVPTRRSVGPYLLVDWAKRFGPNYAEMVELLEKSPI